VINWINGTFGTARTTTAELVVRRSTDLRTFDPESVGYLLRQNLAEIWDHVATAPR